MSGATTSGSVCHFVPAEICWRLVDEGALPPTGFRTVADGAVLFVHLRDVGRTEVGDPGRWMSLCAREIGDFGGDIVEWSGGRIGAIWREETERAAVLKAAACGLSVRQNAGPWDVECRTKVPFFVTIGCGEIAVNALRDTDHGGYFALSGAAVDGCHVLAANARFGDVLITEPGAAVIADQAALTQRSDGGARVDAIPAARHHESVHQPVIYGDATDLQPFARTAGWGREQIAERRPVSVLAVRLPAVCRDSGLDRLQRVFVQVYERLREAGGVVLDVTITEGGLTVAALFDGKSDADRAAALAVTARSRFIPAPRGARSACSFGIASGLAGAIFLDGGRRARVVVGDCLPIATALAHRTEADCLCDDVTRQRAANWFGFESRGRWRPPGTMVELPLNTPTGEVAVATSVDTNAPTEARPLVGWQAVIERQRSAIWWCATGSTDFAQASAFLKQVATGRGARVRTIALSADDRLEFGRAWGLVAKDAHPRYLVQTAMRELKKAVLLEPQILVFTGGVYMDSLSLQALVALTQQVHGVGFLVAGSPQAPTLNWQPEEPEDEVPPALAAVLNSQRKASLEESLQAFENSENPGEKLDELAHDALGAHAFADALDILDASMRRDWKSDGKQAYAQRQLWIGDAYRGLRRDGPATRAYETGLAALGQQSPQRRPSGRVAKVLGRITGRFRVPTVTDERNAYTQKLANELYSRLAQK